MQGNALISYVADELFPHAFGMEAAPHDFEWRVLDRQGVVHRYLHRPSGLGIVAKSFAWRRRVGGTPVTPEEAHAALANEWTAIRTLWEIGLTGAREGVMRPLGVRPDWWATLFAEWVDGEPLGALMEREIPRGQSAGLAAALTRVATFLARLHWLTRQPMAATPPRVGPYLAKLVDQLQAQGDLAQAGAVAVHEVAAHWYGSGILTADGVSLVHGDPTPANLLLRSDGSLVAIDLERAHLDDPAYDLGCVVAELKHAFLRMTGNPWGSEPLIHAFYSAYLDQLPLNPRSRYALTRRGQFYMGVFLLRISRNLWLDAPYRQRLIGEALACLQP